MTTASDVSNLGAEEQEVRGRTVTRRKSKRGSSREVVSNMDSRLARVEIAIGEMRDQLEDTDERIKELDSRGEELKEEMQGALNESLDTVTQSVDAVTQKNTALEAMVVALREEMAELKRELSACKAVIGGGVLVAAPTHRVDVPKPKEFKGTRSAKDVDNFLWGMEQYFRVMGIVEDATKVSTASMYLVDIALLWWRRRCNETRPRGAAITT